MRKIKSHFFIALDGVVEAPDRWHFRYFDDEMGAASRSSSTFSPTLCKARRGKTQSLISGDASKELVRIKSQDGGNIAMSGSPTTVRWLLREGLLDELNLLVHPNLSYAPAED